MKSVQIWSYFWSVFSPNVGKYGPEVTPNRLQMQIFRVFLPLKETLMATRKNVAEQGIMMPNLSQTLQSFWFYSSIFALQKKP